MMLRLLKVLFKAWLRSTMQPAVENPAGVVFLTEAMAWPFRGGRGNRGVNSSESNQNANYRGQSFSSIQCHHCKKFGHIERNCWHKGKKANFAEEKEETESLFMACFSAKESPQESNLLSYGAVWGSANEAEREGTEAFDLSETGGEDAEGADCVDETFSSAFSVNQFMMMKGTTARRTFSPNMGSLCLGRLLILHFLG